MKLSVSGRIILIAVLGVIASSVIILFISTIMMSRLLTRTIHEDMNSMQSIVARMQQQEEEQLVDIISMITTIPELIDAVLAEDHVKIKELAEMFWLRLNVDAVVVTNVDGIVMARGQNDIAGDDISWSPFTQAALGGNTISGVFLNEAALVPFAIRANAPILADGEVIGAVSLAFDIGSEAYIDQLERISGMHFTLFKDDTFLVTSIIDKDGNRGSEMQTVDAQILDDVLKNGETIIVRGEMYNEPSMIAYWPLRDFQDEIVGMWAVSKDLTLQNRETLDVLVIVVLCSLGIILITIFVASRYGKKLALPINKVTGYAIAVADGNLDASLDVQGVDNNNNDEVGLLVGALKTMVATLKDRINEIELKRKEADTANQSKSSFLANMSHEIRTPMNVILGLTEILMRDDKLETTVHEELVAIYSSGDMLLNIINDILDLSKIEAGKLELIPEVYDLASLINDTVVLNLMRIESKQLEFKLIVDENIPSTMIGDELRIKQILNNLLSNAFKYTERGEVILSFSVEKDGENLLLVFSVSDTGSGMSEEEIAIIFDEYTRFQYEPARKISGTGLGMSITQNLVHMMKGEILIESELGKGSLLTVRLPQEQTDAQVLGSEFSKKLQNFQVSRIRQLMKSSIICEPMPYGSVLIVDDVESNLYVARGLLTPYGLTIETVTSGPQAIDKIKDGNIYDIVFMDHMMPKMDGIEATKIIRGLGYTHPIVALTANAVVGQMDIFLKNGFDDFISKPIDVRYMNTVLKKFVRDKQPPEVIEAALKKRISSLAKMVYEPTQNNVSPHLAELFIIDATNAINAIEKPGKNADEFNDDEMQQYIISTHAMKTALLNVNEPELSDLASKLEQAGLRKDTDKISEETPVFLRRLRTVIAKLTLLIDETAEEDPADADYTLLKEQLQRINEACELFDKRTAKSAITELRRLRWNPEINSLLGNMAEHLMSGDFYMLISTAERIGNILEDEV